MLGFPLIAGEGFFGLMKTIRNDVQKIKDKKSVRLS